MKKLATTLFGLFLAVTSFANVNSNEITLPTNEINLVETLQVAPKANTVLNQTIELMILSKKRRKKEKGGPRVVIETCHTKCQDEL